jgi:DNA-binding NarL/FixJ family response regulator
MSACRVMLVDDHALVRRGVAALLKANGRYVVVSEAGDGEDALAKLESVEADIVVLDLDMPRLNGLEVIRRLLKKHPRSRVLVLSMYDDEQFVAQVLRGGARGYILKHAMDDELFSALDAITRGGRYISSSVSPQSVEQQMMDQADLTTREREVMQLIVDGHTTNEVAEMLSISPHTATRHRANLMQKLSVHTQVELVRAAVQRGLVIMPKALDRQE